MLFPLTEKILNLPSMDAIWKDEENIDRLSAIPRRFHQTIQWGGKTSLTVI